MNDVWGLLLVAAALASAVLASITGELSMLTNGLVLIVLADLRDLRKERGR